MVGLHSNSSSSLSHDFKVLGAYTIRLKVTDNDGGIGMDSVRVALTANQPPVAAFKAPGDTVHVGAVVNFDASAGIYFYRLQAETYSFTKKLVVKR